MTNGKFIEEGVWVVSEKKVFLNDEEYKIGMMDSAYLNRILSAPEARERCIGAGLVVDLASRLIDCKSCGCVLKDGSRKLCENGCYLEIMGFDMTHDNAIGSAAVISKMSDLLYRMAWECSGLSDKKQEIKEQSDMVDKRLSDLQDKEIKLKGQEEKLTEKKEEFRKEKDEFHEKKSHLGAKSNYAPRRLVYHELWVKANPKPSYDELAKRLKVSKRTVIRDIKKIRDELAEREYFDDMVVGIE